VHLLLTDRLACPRCGPQFGLILLAHRMDERRVLEGDLGCANCRDRFPVREGFADLRPPPRGPLGDEAAAAPPAAQAADPVADPEEVDRLAALLGVAEGPGELLLIGAPARLAAGLAERVPDVEVLAASADARAWAETPGVSRLAVRARLPLFSRSMRGVALRGDEAADWLDEAVRVVAPLARVVVVDAPAGTLERLREAGLEPLLDESGVAVAVRRS